MKTKGRAQLLAIIMLCSIIMTAMPPKEVKAATYLQTLQFGTSYNFGSEGGYRKFDLVLNKSGRVVINFIAQNSDDGTGIYLYNENETKRMMLVGYSGSYKCSFDLKAGNYVIIFNNSSGSGGHYVSGDPYDKAPADGTMIASFTDSQETFEENLLETNDEYGVASEITLADKKAIKGQFAINDTVDYYSFDVKKDQKLTVNYITSVESSTIHVYKDSLDLEYWSENLTSGSHKTILTLPKGHYYLSVENKNTDSTGNYTLKFSVSGLSSVKLKSVNSTSAKTINVNCAKASVDGYQIQIATDSKFKKAVKTYTSTAASKKITNLKSKTTYYVRVRTITYAKDYKCYSAWSSSKKINVK